MLNAEREVWAQEKARSQQALRSAEAELARLNEEISKDTGTPRIPLSSRESDTDEITWPRSKVGSEWPDCSPVVSVCDGEVMGDGSVMLLNT